MSLLNDMLRDLTHTQKNESASRSASLNVSDDHNELIRNSSLAKPTREIFLPSLFVFVVVLVALLVWKHNFSGALVEPAINESPTPPVELETIQQTTEIDNSLNTNPEEHVDETIHTAKDATELNERLAALETAITKLSTVVERQESAADLDNVAAVDRVSTNAAQEVSVSIRDPFGLDLQAEAVNSQEENPDVIPADAHLAIAPNPQFLDQRKAERGRYLFAQGQVNEAILELKPFIFSAEAPRESVKALLDILSYQENAEAMEALLKTATYLSVPDQQFYLAKAAIIQNREEYAVDLLEAHLLEAEDHESYRALLAGLYQRTGKYLEAAAAYRRLLGSFGEKPAYWLGFALAQDALSENHTAKQAYLRLAQYADLQPQVQEYIQQRLAALR
jgi:tetratricopeptide (TPR) repeat protein